MEGVGIPTTLNMMTRTLQIMGAMLSQIAELKILQTLPQMLQTEMFETKNHPHRARQALCRD